MSMLATPPDTIRNWYVIKLKPQGQRSLDVAASIVAVYGGHATHVYEHVLSGFAVANIDPQQLKRLASDGRVAYIEDVSRPVRSTADQSLASDGTQWGLGRGDQRTAAYNQNYSYFYNGQRPSGQGVHIYIVDSGIRGNHVQFTGRIGNGVTKIFLSLGANPYVDQSGHGTAVAGIAAGSTHGIAKGAILHSVRVNDNNTSWITDVLAGLDWIAVNGLWPGVVNVSIETNSVSVSGAFDVLVNRGLQVFKAAGNDNRDACQVSENVNTFVVVVSGSDFQDQRARRIPGEAPFANFGTCVDVFASASNIRTAARGAAAADTLVWGTSMAAPFAAGVGALILQQDPYATPARLKQVIEASATLGALTNIGAGSPNRLLNSHHRFLGILGVGSWESQSSPTNVTWDAYSLGGNGLWSWSWEVSVNGGAFQFVGSGSSYTRTILAGEQSNLTLRVTGTSLGESLVSTKSVTITPAQACGGLPSC